MLIKDFIDAFFPSKFTQQKLTPHLQAVTALFSLYKAAGDASSAVFDLIDYLQNSGFDTTELRTAFGGANTPPNAQAAPVTPAKKTRGNKTTESQSATSQASNAAPAAPVESAAPAAESAGTQGEAEEKPKRAKRVKDPNAPKRPLNSFLKFRNQEQRRISQDRKSKGEPELARDEMITAVKNSWENLPQSVRDTLDRESKEELGRYHTELTAYKANNNFTASQSQDPEHDNAPSSQEPLSQEPLSQEPLTQESATQEDSQDGASPSKRKPKRKDDKEKKKKKSKTQ